MADTPKTAVIITLIGIVGATISAFINGQGVFFERQNDAATAVTAQQQQLPQTPQPPAEMSFQPLTPVEPAIPTPIENSSMAQPADLAHAEPMTNNFTDNPSFATTQNTTTTSHRELQLTLQRQVEQANEILNLVWNGTSSAVRQKLLTDQRVWLKKRDLQCRLSSQDAQSDLGEVARLRCEVEATNQRVDVLQQMVARAEAEQPAPAAAVTTVATATSAPQQPSKSASDLATERAAAESAAKFAENVQRLERELRGY